MRRLLTCFGTCVDTLDLTLALHSVKRQGLPFTPNVSHELALIHIGHYLKGTANKGLILKPIEVTKFNLDAYVDSDFMGKFDKERPDNLNNVQKLSWSHPPREWVSYHLVKQVAPEHLPQYNDGGTLRAIGSKARSPSIANSG